MAKLKNNKNNIVLEKKIKNLHVFKASTLIEINQTKNELFFTSHTLYFTY